MCGRYVLTRDARALAEEFAVEPPAVLAPRSIIAPPQAVLSVRERAHRRAAMLVRWCLVPSWAEDIAIGNRLIYARGETVATKPAFRAAYRHRRCLVPAGGYYEWQAREGRKQPRLVTRADGRCFAIAGVWEHWQRDGNELETVSLITCTANAGLKLIHDRMPVVIAHADYARWLAPAETSKSLAPLLVSAADSDFVARAVSTRVNSPRNDDPACSAALDAAP